jgi:DNA-binding NarL/FixJ family response regulator
VAIRVLIVEDSKPTRETLCEWLDAMGGFHIVGTAASEMEATEWLQGHGESWDVAILDLMIESGSGFNLIKRAKQSSGQGKAVVFSAYATPAIAQRCVALGAEAAFEKSEPGRFISFLEGLRSAQPATCRQRPH